jgi:hypothetical protein
MSKVTEMHVNGNNYGCGAATVLPDGLNMAEARKG